MKLISCQSKGNLFARIYQRDRGSYAVHILVFAHWKNGFLSWLETSFGERHHALDFVSEQFKTYGGK